MDPSILIILAIIILIIALIYFSKKSKTGDSGSSGEIPGAGLDLDTTEKIDNNPVNPPPNPKRVTPGGGIPGTSGSLYISPELDKSRNADIHTLVETVIIGFNPNDVKGEFIYTLQLKKAVWICPYCEGENSKDDEICMICGKEIGA